MIIYIIYLQYIYIDIVNVINRGRFRYLTPQLRLLITVVQPSASICTLDSYLRICKQRIPPLSNSILQPRSTMQKQRRKLP